MTAAEYRHALDMLDMSPPECAELFGVDRSTAYRWGNEANHFEIPRAIEMWLRYMARATVTPAEIRHVTAKPLRVPSYSR